MAVITISRDFSKGSDEIIERVAKLCQLAIVDKHQLANLLSEYGLTSFENFYDSEHNFIDRFDSRSQAYIEMMDKAVYALAKRGNLILVGRGGFRLLGPYADALNVLITAPKEQRATELLESGEVSEADSALMIVEQRDNVRKKFLQTYYAAKSLEAKDFDLVINAGKMTPELAAELITHAFEHLADKASPASLKLSALEADPILLDAVEKMAL